MMIQYSTPSGRLATTTQVTIAPGAIQGIDLMPPNAGYAVLTVYDTSVGDLSSLIVTQLYVDAGTQGLNHEYFSPVAINRGIYCTLTMTPDNTGASFYVRYAAG